MTLSEPEAYKRLHETARSTAPALVVDRGSVHRIDGPYPGVAYTLVLGEARALLFMPAADIDGSGWEARLRARLEAAHRYLIGFTHAIR